MPPRKSSAGAWTPAERVGAVLVVWAAALTALSIVLIGWGLWRWLS